MKKYYRKASMFFSACISCSLAFASVGDDYLKGWNDTQKGTPAQVGWGSQQDIEWGTNGDKDASWRINVGSPVNNGDDAMLYTTVPDNKLYYAIHDLPTGMLYQLSGKTWRRNGGTGSLDSHFTITSNINNGSILLDYTSTVSGNNVTKEFQSERFIIPKNTESTLYLTWDCTLNGGSWQNAGIWGLQLVELGEALTVTFDTGGGSTVSPQYLLKDGKEQAKEPLAPTKTGYTFLGWYTSLSSDTPYDFSSVVTHDITIYAKWEDGKEKLKTQIANAEKIIKEGTEKGKKYLNAAITEAKTVAQNSQATSEEIENAIKSLSTAVSQYQDSTLSSLTVDGKTITGFLPTVYEYTYSLSVSETNIPQTAVTTNATCAAYEIQNTTTIPGITTVTVTAGNGSTATYSIKFVHNYLDGWDANGFTDRSPYDVGWRCSDENFEWSTDVADQNTKGTYRDDLNVGRVFIHPQNEAIFSYPIAYLKAGQVYTFSCSSSKMSGKENRPTTFAISTEADGSGTIIASHKADAKKWTAYTNHKFSFIVPEDGKYYLTWQTEHSDGDRSLAWNFNLTTSPISASTLSTFANGALSSLEELTLSGEFTKEDFEILSAKIGKNQVLTHVDLTQANIAEDARDIFNAINPNTIKYFAEKATVPKSWTNSVIGNTTESIVLTDGYPFHNIKEITAKKVSYARTFTQGWSTLSIPFPVSDISGIEGNIEKFKSLDSEKNMVNFEPADKIEACRPYLLYTGQEKKNTFVATNTVIPITAPAEGIFKATFQLLAGIDAKDKLILVDHDDTQTFLKATDKARIPAFRAFLGTDTEAELLVNHAFGDITSIKGLQKTPDFHLSTTSAGCLIIQNGTNTKQLHIYTLNGVIVRNLQLEAGEIVILNDIPRGIYLIENQKIAIK